MDIIKSSRHSKITGNFAEQFALYWLSKHGTECAYVDHTGIDIIAKLPNKKKLIGISVKSRSRKIGKEFDNVLITKKDIESAVIACETFNADPYFAIVIDGDKSLMFFLMPLKTFSKFVPISNKSGSFKATKKAIESYKKDKSIWVIECNYTIGEWDSL